MRISKGLKEDGVVVGNTYDKYGSKNPIVQWIMQGFNRSLSDLVSKVSPKTIHEVGCGEGFWVLDWNGQGLPARGSDFSGKVIAMARANAENRGQPKDLFAVRSIYDLDPGEDSAELMVCCEVLEHLENPDKALGVLHDVATDFLIVSVPREPLWRILNFVRGKYVSQLGNTPGHLQHWSGRQFLGFVSRTFDIIEVRKPIPWTMLLCRKRQ